MEQNTSRPKKYLLVLLLIIVLIALGFIVNSYKTQIKRFLGFATVTDAFLLRAIDQNWTTTGYAWGENVGWISFEEENGDIYVGDYQLLGYAWGENIGWVSLNCLNTDSCGTVSYAVENDGAGILSGYAWGENIGWIDFAPTNGGVTIGSDGVFSGFAWGENIGWINFEATGNVSTNWRHQADRPECNNGLDDNSNGVIDYPADTYCNSLTDDSERRTGGYSSGGSSVVTNVGGDITDTTSASTTASTTLDSSTTTTPVSTSTPDAGPTEEQPTIGPNGEQPGQTGEVTVTFTGRFTRDLTIGDVGDDVKNLQMFLNNNGFVLADSGVGSPNNETTFYGNRTRDAVKKYQEANASSILDPVGLAEGTGYFGRFTRNYINSVLGE